MTTEQPYLARRQNWTNQLARHALMQPGATALRFMGHTTTWAEFDHRVTKLADALSRRGVGFGDRVMILMLNRPEFVEATLAANQLGAIAVPVNFRLTPRAVLTHTNLAGQAMTGMYTTGPDINNDVGFIGVPLFHIAGIGNTLGGLMLGTPTVIHPLGGFDPGQLLDVLEAERVTGIFLVPAQWQAVCAAQKAKPRDIRLRALSWGAAPASDTLLREMSETFPDSKILAAFGQTEMSPVTCMLLGDDAIRKRGSVGKVIPTVAARIVDEDMNDVPVGEVGEIVYRAPTLMAGYWNNPQATAEAFAGGWFHSGDLVRADADGYIWVVDRKKDMIISGGENIYCAEVENVLAAHPAIVEVAVIGRAHPKWGEVPVAVAAINAAALRLEELDEFLTERLARYKHPKGLEIVDALPRNPAGKVLKTELRIRFSASAATDLVDETGSEAADPG
ncbi:MAG: AMP-binding protein [Mycolicibacterium aromaticivorans]|nr:AMP-binding protein [Mycolicibacterium aromaticivorans]